VWGRHVVVGKRWEQPRFWQLAGQACSTLCAPPRTVASGTPICLLYLNVGLRLLSSLPPTRLLLCRQAAMALFIPITLMLLLRPCLASQDDAAGTARQL
jgi:hypothetical protein